MKMAIFINASAISFGKNLASLPLFVVYRTFVFQGGYWLIMLYLSSK